VILEGQVKLGCTVEIGYDSEADELTFKEFEPEATLSETPDPTYDVQRLHYLGSRFFVRRSINFS
jgi:hypothetical protein